MLKQFLLYFLLLGGVTLSAQNIIGLWEIKQVKVGSQTMTPVAKWTKINKDKTFQSGNGWLQNSEGTWSYDRTKKLYSPKEKKGIIDEFGPYTVEFTDKGMNWLREEEGMIVTVNLERINTLPKSTADQLVGLWDLASIKHNDADITNTFDPQNKFYIFFRWDRIYKERTIKGKRVSGYWHINGHKPEITMLPHSKDKNAESWRVEVSESNLKLIGISDSNKETEMNFYRLYQFPK